MGLLSDYFAAPSDADAVAVLTSGPRAAAQTGAPITGIVDSFRVEPLVQLATLEEILGGRTFDDQLAAGQQPIATAESGEAWVVAVSDVLVAGLTEATGDELAAAVEPWAGTDEMHGAEPALVHEMVTELARLARHARQHGLRVYCWLSL